MTCAALTRWSATIAVATALGACDNDRPLTPAVDAPVIALPAGAAQPRLQLIAEHDDGTSTFAVRVNANALALSAFQGVVSFPRGALELVSITTPRDPESGAVFVVNSDHFADGRVAFAALTTTAFAAAALSDGVEAFRMTVRATRNTEPVDIGVTLDVAGQDSGDPVSADRLLPSPTVRYLTK